MDHNEKSQNDTRQDRLALKNYIFRLFSFNMYFSVSPLENYKNTDKQKEKITITLISFPREYTLNMFLYFLPVVFFFFLNKLKVSTVY